MDLAPDEARLRLAQEQLALHAAKLAAYEADARLERRGDASAPGLRTVEHWRGATLPMGILYERAAILFWTSVAENVVPVEAAAGQI